VVLKFSMKKNVKSHWRMWLSNFAWRILKISVINVWIFPKP
jgi:hypothetical protein